MEIHFKIASICLGLDAKSDNTEHFTPPITINDAQHATAELSFYVQFQPGFISGLCYKWGTDRQIIRSKNRGCDVASGKSCFWTTTEKCENLEMLHLGYVIVREQHTQCNNCCVPNVNTMFLDKVLFLFSEYLKTTCGIMTPYGHTQLGQHKLR